MESEAVVRTALKRPAWMFRVLINEEGVFFLKTLLLFIAFWILKFNWEAALTVEWGVTKDLPRVSSWRSFIIQRWFLTESLHFY